MTKVIVGRNSVFKIFPTEATTLELPPPSKEELPVAPLIKRKRAEETTSGNTSKRRTHGHSLKKNSAAMAPLVNTSEDTATLRSNHIMERLQKERIVSLYSLRSSIIEMENYHFENTNVQFIVGHRVDTRSILRILDALEQSKKLTQQHCEIPLKTTATPGTRIIHIVKAIGVTEAELNSYLVRHSRDTRIQLLKTKAFAHPGMSVSEADGRVQPIDPSKITYLLKTKLSEVHKDNLVRIKQARTLGMSYGMMYRCHLFHRLVFEYLSNDPLPLATLLQDTSLDPTISVLFSLDHVLQSVKVRQYVRIFGIGHVLTPNEFTVVEQALQRDLNLKDLDASIRSKLTHRQSRRCMRMLNTLKTLRLIGSYRLHLEQLLKLMHDDGHGLDVPQLVEHTMYDRSTSSLLVFHRHIRVMLDDTSPKWEDTARARVNATRHQYSFGHNLPLHLTLDSVDDVELYWEALQCCSLESLSYSSGPGQIHTFPKPIAFRHVNIFAPISWTSLTQSIRYDKRKDRERAAIIPGSARMTRPRRDYTERAFHAKGKRKVVSKRKRRSVQVEHAEFTPEEDQAMVAAYFAQLETNWHVAVPTDMQKDGEEVAIRSPSVYRVHTSIVAVSRTLQRLVMPTNGVVRRHLVELLNQITAKQAYLALTKRVFSTKEFSEELEIRNNPRLSALLVRVLMIVLSPDSSYVQMAAEHLLVQWNRTEINTVWRYLWLRGWIVQASTTLQRNLHRGYVLSHKLSLLWRDNVSFPLSLFEEAAEHASVLEEIDEKDVAVEVCPPLMHSAFVLGNCTFQLEYNSDRSAQIKTSNVSKKRKDIRCSEGSGDGIAGHLNKLQPCRDPWSLTTYFSQATTDDEWWLVFSTSDERPWKKPKRSVCSITESEILTAVGNAKENGLCLTELVAALKTYERSLVHSTVLELVHQNELKAVHGYVAPRYILPQYEEFWYICAYTVAPNGNTVYDTQSPGLLPHAWLQLNGHVNTFWWALIQRKIMQHIITSPGADEDAIWCYMEKILSLEEIRELLAQLVTEDVIYARVVEKSSVSLFSTKVKHVCIPAKPLPEIDRDAYIVRYFPQPDCIEKFGMLCRDEN
ncbi:hypothetical protein THRCLA_11900 [Thraustotheca clavata]|uniref:GTF3C1 extended winged-helix domain-containing protein n=1 Tax=Thraustotheca clavata TaxID=74557 RepID=A0A1V9Y5H6_9STRA|nr:hypothetical protein THRCLA_11900 [Thraustotheca clavata]